MIEEQFITFHTPRFIKALRPFLDIEKVNDFKQIKKSSKSLLCWHPTANKGKPLWEYFKANNLPAYFVERGALPNTAVIDPNGFLCDSSSYNEEHWNHPLTQDELKEIDDYIHELTTDTASLEFQRSGRLDPPAFFKRLGVPHTRELIFVPLQLERDTVIKLWSGWVQDVPTFYQHVERLARQFPDKTFMVKPHPLSNFRVRSQKNLINVDNLHYKDCLAYCSKVLTINSGVGLQAMAWEKPTIVCGRGFYQFDGINYHATSLETLTTLLNSTLSQDVEKSKRFLHFLKFKLYSDCIQVKRPDTQSQKINRTDEVRFTNARIFKCD